MKIQAVMSPPKHSAAGQHRTAMVCFVVLLSVLASSVRAQPKAATKKVVVLYWYNKDYSWNVSFDQTFQDTLRAYPAANIEYYAEYLESDRFPEEKQSALLHRYLRQKYGDRIIDAVVATSDATLDFLLKHRTDLFAKSPIVFVAARNPTEERLASGPGMTGILNMSTHEKTLNLALKLHPDTDHVYVVSGTLEHDKRLETLARYELQGYGDKVEITYLTDFTPDQLVATVKEMPTTSLLLYVWQQSLDKQGKILEAADILASFAPYTLVPIYGMTDPTIGLGIVGGFVNSAESIGTRTAEIVKQVVNGTRPQDLPVENALSVPVFDWRELNRWGIDEKKLPADSIIRFRKFSLWEQHREYVLGAVTLIAILTGLVGWLLWERRKRMESESVRLQLATIVESSEDAIIGLSLDGRIRTWNIGAALMYGYSEDEVVGQSISVVVPPDRMDELSSYLVNLAAAERIEHFETVRLRKNGERIDVSVGVSYIRDSRGRIVAASSIGRDISARKRIEEALRESEQELQRLTVSLLNLQDTERRRLAGELHDVTAQNIFALNMNLARLQRGVVGPAETEALLAESRQLCDQALQEIRTLSYLLHPPMLDQAGLVGALRWYVEGFGRRSGIHIDIRRIEEVGRLPGDVETALFRVVQEGLTNISRHSGSSTGSIRLQRQGDQVVLQITDYGHGMSRLALSEAEGPSTLGVGIPAMRQRLRQFEGTLRLESSDQGTTVTASVPARIGGIDDTDLVGGRSQASA